MSLSDQTGATFSPCRQYRYRLWRIWEDTLKPACFILMNPSTADEINDDPTVARQQQRVTQWPGPSVGGVVVVNVFAWRETDSTKLAGLMADGTDLVGRDNDAAIIAAAREAAIVVCGWGRPGNLNGRGQQVLKLLREHGVTPHYLKLNKDGTPKHPLFVGYRVKPQEWKA